MRYIKFVYRWDRDSNIKKKYRIRCNKSCIIGSIQLSILTVQQSFLIKHNFVETKSCSYETNYVNYSLPEYQNSGY